MNYKMIGRLLAQTLLVEALFMIPALVVSLCGGETAAALGFALSIAIAALAGGGLWLACRKGPRALNAREGFVCVAISWIVLSLVGCLPFYLSGEIHLLIDAY